MAIKRKFEPRPSQVLEVTLGEQVINMTIRRVKASSADFYVTYSNRVKNGEIPTFDESKKVLERLIENWDQKIENFIDDLDIDYLIELINDITAIASGNKYDDEEKKSQPIESPTY